MNTLMECFISNDDLICEMRIFDKTMIYARQSFLLSHVEGGVGLNIVVLGSIR